MQNVKGAIDRQTSPASLPQSVIAQVNQWSSTQDTFGHHDGFAQLADPATGMPAIPGVWIQENKNNALQSIEQAAGGVKFGTNVVVTAQAQAARRRRMPRRSGTPSNCSPVWRSCSRMATQADRSYAVADGDHKRQSAERVGQPPADQLVGVLKQAPKKMIQRKM